MKEFDQLQIVTSGKISADDLNEAIKKIILWKASIYRYFVLQQEEDTTPDARLVITDSKVINWVLYGTNNIDELLNLISENGISFYKVTIANMEASVIKMNTKEVATEKVYGMSEKERKELLGALLAESLLTRKTMKYVMSLDKSPWKPIPKEEILAYEKQIRNSRSQSSCSGAFHNDVCSLIERLISEENYIYQFYVVTITGEPAEGVMGGITYWEIEGYNNEDLSNEKLSRISKLLSSENVRLFMVDETGIKQVSR